jgi:hypothetical protein
LSNPPVPVSSSCSAPGALNPSRKPSMTQPTGPPPSSHTSCFRKNHVSFPPPRS